MRTGTLLRLAPGRKTPGRVVSVDGRTAVVEWRMAHGVERIHGVVHTDGAVRLVTERRPVYHTGGTLPLLGYTHDVIGGPTRILIHDRRMRVVRRLTAREVFRIKCGPHADATYDSYSDEHTDATPDMCERAASRTLAYEIAAAVVSRAANRAAHMQRAGRPESSEAGRVAFSVRH